MFPIGGSPPQTMRSRSVVVVLIISVLMNYGALVDSQANLYWNPQCGSAPLNNRRKGTIGNDWTYNSSSETSPYIMNSVAAKYGDWPSVVSIVLVSGYQGTACGGVIFSANEVWTAGHCVETIAGSKRGHIKLKGNDWNGRPSIQIKTGKYHRAKRDPYTRTYYASGFYLSPNFNLKRDWARIFLATPIQFSDYAQPACVRRRADEENRVSRGYCFLAGFGATHYVQTIFGSVTETYPTVQQYLALKKVKCIGIGDQDPGRVCFASRDGKNRTPCPGDSGSPVLCLDEKNRWNVVGLVSTGPYCNSRDPYPKIGLDVYAKVSQIVKNWKQDG